MLISARDSVRWRQKITWQWPLSWSLGFPDEKSYESAVDKLTEEASAIVMPWPPDEISAEGDATYANPSPAKKQGILWSSFDSQMRNKERVTSQRLTGSELAVRRHLEAPCIQRDANPLEWWRDRVGTNPRIARIAKDVLGIPATSVPSERIFSKAGELISCRRTCGHDIVFEQCSWLIQFISFKINP